jgi:hypothetical protein
MILMTNVYSPHLDNWRCRLCICGAHVLYVISLPIKQVELKWGGGYSTS